MAKSSESFTLYVGCGLTNAPSDFVIMVELLKDVLKKKYELFDFVGLTAGTAADVYKWDIGHCVSDCDMFVAICDYPSLGLGWELSEATRLNKPVLGVAHNDTLVTRLVLGAAEAEPNFIFRRYDDLVNDVPAYVEELINQNKNS